MVVGAGAAEKGRVGGWGVGYERGQCNLPCIAVKHNWTDTIKLEYGIVIFSLQIP